MYLREEDNKDRNLSKIGSHVDQMITGLPLSRHGSIFIAQDKSREYILKALIVGPIGSIYENGCFEFDIMIPPGDLAALYAWLMIMVRCRIPQQASTSAAEDHIQRGHPLQCEPLCKWQSVLVAARHLEWTWLE